MRLLTALCGVTILLALATSSPRYVEGTVKYYSQGTFERVAAYKNIDLGGASGYASFPDCSRIGGLIYVSVLNPRTSVWSAWHSKRIVDCSQSRDRTRHEAIRLVELSYEDAIKYGYKSAGRTSIRYYLGVNR